MTTYEGTVDGLDVIAAPGESIRCFAFINDRPGEYIQVETSEGRLQTALETATVKKARVEVSYTESGPQKVLTRVRLLDR
jgi:hypothetical protein